MIAGCNGCHAAGYLLSEGNVPEKNWPTGDRLGWNGPYVIFPQPSKQQIRKDDS